MCSNGHICLDILYDGQNGAWSPALTISKLCLSLRSMLASNTEKVSMQQLGRAVHCPCWQAYGVVRLFHCVLLLIGHRGGVAAVRVSRPCNMYWLQLLKDVNQTAGRKKTEGRLYPAGPRVTGPRVDYCLDIKWPLMHVVLFKGCIVGHLLIISTIIYFCAAAVYQCELHGTVLIGYVLCTDCIVLTLLHLAAAATAARR